MLLTIRLWWHETHKPIAMLKPVRVPTIGVCYVALFLKFLILKYKQFLKTFKMNEQTAKLVEQLAQELGTTADYLWSVLLKQAPISALTDLIFVAFTIFVGFVIYKVHKHLLSENDGENSIYYNLEEAAVVPMIFVSGIWAIMCIACLFSIGNIVNGFLNPEYWALKEILSSLNQ